MDNVSVSDMPEKDDRLPPPQRNSLVTNLLHAQPHRARAFEVWDCLGLRTIISGLGVENDTHSCIPDRPKLDRYDALQSNMDPRLLHCFAESSLEKVFTRIDCATRQPVALVCKLLNHEKLSVRWAPTNDNSEGIESLMVWCLCMAARRRVLVVHVDLYVVSEGAADGADGLNVGLGHVVHRQVLPGTLEDTRSDETESCHHSYE